MARLEAQHGCEIVIRLAYASLILQGVNDLPSLQTNDAIDV
jgi:hypothetical protein